MITRVVLPVLLALPATAQREMMSPRETEESATRGLRFNRFEAFEGYTLLSPLNASHTYLIDMDGEVVHEWDTDSAAGAEYLLDDGTLLRSGREDDDPRFRGGGIGGRIQMLAPDGTLIWNWRLANEREHQHHDIEPLPNGNVLMILWERIPRDVAIAHGRDPEQVGKNGLWADAVIEVKPILPDDAEVVWRWRSWDQVVQDRDAKLPNYAEIPNVPGKIDINADHRDSPPMTEEERKAEEEMLEQLEALGYVGGEEEDEESDPNEFSGDWMHTNSVEYLPELDLIALSSPEFNELWVIDHSTTTEEAASDRGGRWGKGGQILWRWGNPRVYGAGVNGDRRLFYQHNPTWIYDGKELRLLVFNNGGRRPDGDYSTVEELVLPFDPERGFVRQPGQPWGPKEPAWVYENREGFYSPFISGAQRLPNGNTFICSGAAGRLFEVMPNGEVVWDYYSPFGGEITPPDHAGNAPPLALFRGTRLGKNHPGIRALLGSSDGTR